VEFEPAEVPSSGIGSATLVVVPARDGLVAIAYDGKSGSLVWTSNDGHSWTEHPEPGLENAGIAAAIAFSGGLLAVGRDTSDIETEVAAAWISSDGRAWRRVAGGDEMTGQMIDVVESDGGLFAIGGVPGADAAGVWSSDDGEIWRVRATFEHAFLWSIVEGGPGLVASGWRRNPEPDLAVWTSTDGAAWTLAPDPEGFDGFEGADLLVHEGSLVMLGRSVFASGTQIWTSADGTAWEPAFDVPQVLETATLRGLVGTPAGIVAVGAMGTEGAAWISSDGDAWAPLGEPVPDAFFIGGFAADDRRLIVTGATQEGTLETGIETAAMIWIVDLNAWTGLP
jgi:hypothetical protein